MGRLPNLSPLIYPDAVCSECGEVMNRELVKGPRGSVQKVIYSCVNPEKGCRYKVESDQRLTGMQLPLPYDPETK